MSGTYESNLSFLLEKKTVRFSFLAPRSQRIPLMDSLMYLKGRAQKELWRKRMKGQTNASLLYIGQTGKTGDGDTKFFIIDPHDYSERQRDEVMRWMYETKSCDMTCSEYLSEEDYKAYLQQVSEISVVDISETKKLGIILHAFNADGKWFLESHDITNPQIMQLVDDIYGMGDLELLQ